MNQGNTFVFALMDLMSGRDGSFVVVVSELYVSKRGEHSQIKRSERRSFLNGLFRGGEMLKSEFRVAEVQIGIGETVIERDSLGKLGVCLIVLSQPEVGSPEGIMRRDVARIDRNGCNKLRNRPLAVFAHEQLVSFVKSPASFPGRLEVEL